MIKDIKEITEKYRAIRREVYEEATRPASNDAARHQANKDTFRDKVTEICDAAQLSDFQKNDNATRESLWRHLWTKNRYAGIRAGIAGREIEDLTPIFDDHKWFSDSGWNLQSKGHKFCETNTGKIAKEFLMHDGQFKGLHTVSNVPKLKKIISTARAYARYFKENPTDDAIKFVIGGFDETSVWDIQQRLLDLGYGADLTALHFMMDTGFRVIKPDVVVSRLFLDWGWLHYADQSLPMDLTRDDLLGRGRYKSRYHYTKPVIYRPIIDLANKIVQHIKADDLNKDIGWSTNNPLREFDLFVVKSGQLPEPDFGIEKRLYD